MLRPLRVSKPFTVFTWAWRIIKHLLGLGEKYIQNYIYMYLYILANVHAHIEVISIKIYNI